MTEQPRDVLAEAGRALAAGIDTPEHRTIARLAGELCRANAEVGSYKRMADNAAGRIDRYFYTLNASQHQAEADRIAAELAEALDNRGADQ